jgi:hypothetical protein
MNILFSSIRINKFYSSILASFFSLYCSGQLPANANSKIFGPAEVCAEQKETYSFKHPTKDCNCLDIDWNITGGVLDEPIDPNYPFNEKAKIKWGKGNSGGTISLLAINCFTSYDAFGNPNIDRGLDHAASFVVDITDAGMVDLLMIQENDISCDRNRYTFKLLSSNINLIQNELTNISWTVPPGWTIEPNSTSSGLPHGASFPNMIVNTNGLNDGLNQVQVSYSAPNYCAAKSYTREAVLSFNGLCQNITYTSQPNSPVSHSEKLTLFTLSSTQQLTSGNTYEFASGELIDIRSNFDLISDANTSFNTIIDQCGCTSEFIDPNFTSKGSIIYIGNYTKMGSHKVYNEKISSQEMVLSKIEMEEAYSLYPNPTSGPLHFNSSVNLGIIHFEIRNISGRLLQEIKVPEDESSFIEIDLKGLENGIYIITVFDQKNKFIYSSKVFKFK